MAGATQFFSRSSTGGRGGSSGSSGGSGFYYGDGTEHERSRAANMAARGLTTLGNFFFSDEDGPSYRRRRAAIKDPDMCQARQPLGQQINSLYPYRDAVGGRQRPLIRPDAWDDSAYDDVPSTGDIPRTMKSSDSKGRARSSTDADSLAAALSLDIQDRFHAWIASIKYKRFSSATVRAIVTATLLVFLCLLLNATLLHGPWPAVLSTAFWGYLGLFSLAMAVVMLVRVHILAVRPVVRPLVFRLFAALHPGRLVILPVFCAAHFLAAVALLECWQCASRMWNMLAFLGDIGDLVHLDLNAVALAAGVGSHALLCGVWLVLSQRNVLHWPAVQTLKGLQINTRLPRALKHAFLWSTVITTFTATACWFAADEISASIANFLQINAESAFHRVYVLEWATVRALFLTVMCLQFSWDVSWHVLEVYMTERLRFPLDFLMEALLSPETSYVSILAHQALLSIAEYPSEMRAALFEPGSASFIGAARLSNAARPVDLPPTKAAATVSKFGHGVVQSAFPSRTTRSSGSSTVTGAGAPSATVTRNALGNTINTTGIAPPVVVATAASKVTAIPSGNGADELEEYVIAAVPSSSQLSAWDVIRVASSHRLIHLRQQLLAAAKLKSGNGLFFLTSQQAADQLFGDIHLQAAALQALSMLLVASYEEDKAGVVQRSFAQTLSLFALIDAALEDYVQSEACPVNLVHKARAGTTYSHPGAAALAETLQNSIYRVMIVFQNVLSNFTFRPEVQPQLQEYLEACR